MSPFIPCQVPGRLLPKVTNHEFSVNDGTYAMLCYARVESLQQSEVNIENPGHLLTYMNLG